MDVIGIIASAQLSGAGGSGAYHADGVHISEDYLFGTSLSIAPTTSVSGSVWFKIEELGDSDYLYLPIYDNDNTECAMQMYNTGSVSFTWQDPTYVNSIAGYTDNGFLPLAVGWHHLLYSFELSGLAGSRNYAVYLDDVKQTVINNGETGGAIFVNFNDDVYFPDNWQNTALEVDFALVWFAPGVSLLTEAGVISEANRRLFISAEGKPVDPSGYPTGAILFNGDASTFVTNQGTSGVFTLTGVLTNASTSPSD